MFNAPLDRQCKRVSTLNLRNIHDRLCGQKHANSGYLRKNGFNLIAIAT